MLLEEETDVEPEFDLCVIGAGAAGMAAAVRAWDLGQKVCVVENTNFGGAEVSGAMASKTMWQLSRLVQSLRQQLHETGLYGAMCASPGSLVLFRCFWFLAFARPLLLLLLKLGFISSDSC